MAGRAGTADRHPLGLKGYDEALKERRDHFFFPAVPSRNAL